MAHDEDSLELVGQLAGGIAHDFNNVLSVILAYTDSALEALEPDSPLREDLTQIREATVRGAALTRQLLAFSGRQLLQPQRLDLNAWVTRSSELLRRSLGEQVELVTSLAPDLGAVEVDPGQLEQVLLNLAINAREAMPSGGRLTLATRNDGKAVVLALSDTGIGMDAATRARAFEPFFTTKPSGLGTGLGLAAAYGIVRQSGGDIRVDSDPGRGTTFTIGFPRTEAER